MVPGAEPMRGVIQIHNRLTVNEKCPHPSTQPQISIGCFLATEMGEAMADQPTRIEILGKDDIVIDFDIWYASSLDCLPSSHLLGDTFRQLLTKCSSETYIIKLSYPRLTLTCRRTFVAKDLLTNLPSSTYVLITDTNLSHHRSRYIPTFRDEFHKLTTQLDLKPKPRLLTCTSTYRSSIIDEAYLGARTDVIVQTRYHRERAPRAVKRKPRLRTGCCKYSP
jgi:hypothetical protein